MSSKALIKMSRHELMAYVDEQSLPFVRINEKAIAAGRQPPFLNPRMEAIRYELITRDDGSIVKKERSVPLLSEVGEVSNQWLAQGKQLHTDGEKVLSRRISTGKYNDSEFLEVCQPCSVEVGEVESFRNMD